MFRFLIVILSTSIVASCTRGAKSDRDVLVVALESSPNTLDPRFATDAYGERIAGLLFSALVRKGANLEVVGDAAEHWEYDEKSKTYSFQLRPGLTFSDGTPLTAEDIIFSFEQFKSPRCPFRGSFQAIEAVDAHYDANARDVKLRLSEYSATLLPDLSSLRFLPKKSVLRLADDFGRAPIGSGSFKVTQFTTNEIRLQARREHPYAVPKAKTVLFRIVRDDNTRFLKTYKGEIDVVQSAIPLIKVATLEKKGDFQIFKFPGQSMTYLLLNLQDPILKQPRVRQAIAMAINRDDIIRFKLEGLAIPSATILSPRHPFFNSDLHPPEFSIAAARKIIQDAGLTGTELTLKTSNVQLPMENGKVLANQIEASGLKIRVQSFEWGTYYSDIQKGRFQLALMKWVGVSDPDIYRTALHSREVPENAGRNRGRYLNSTLDPLLEQGMKVVNREERIRLYREVQRIVLADLPFIPLWHEFDVAIAHKRVHNYKPSANGDFSALIDAYKE